MIGTGSRGPTYPKIPHMPPLGYQTKQKRGQVTFRVESCIKRKHFLMRKVTCPLFYLFLPFLFFLTIFNPVLFYDLAASRNRKRIRRNVFRDGRTGCYIGVFA